jgi:hypothetical protein
MKLGVNNSKIESVSKSGIYEANFEGYELIEETKFGKAIRMYFNVSDNGEMKTISGLARYYDVITPSSKLYKWIAAIAGQDSLENGDFDLDNLIGAPVQVVISNKKVNDNIYSNVVEVIAKGQTSLNEVKK